jgi:hypothetical protein
MADIIIKLKDGSVHEFKHTGRPGGSWDVKYPEVIQAHYDAADRVLLPTAANSLRDRIALAVAYAEQRGEKRAAPSPDTRLEAWAVECLDAWAHRGRHKKVSWWMRNIYGEGRMEWECLLYVPGAKTRIFCGDDPAGGTSPQYARIAAARALSAADPTLPKEPSE